VRFPCVHAAATTPVQRLGVFLARLTPPYQPSPKPLPGRPAHRHFRGLLGVYLRCGLHTRAVTNFVTAIRGLQTFCRLHACPGCFRLERSPGGVCTRGKAPPCHGARGYLPLALGVCTVRYPIPERNFDYIPTSRNATAGTRLTGPSPTAVLAEALPSPNALSPASGTRLTFDTLRYATNPAQRMSS
jgi:hypothetical protein